MTLASCNYKAFLITWLFCLQICIKPFYNYNSSRNLQNGFQHYKKTIHLEPKTPIGPNVVLSSSLWSLLATSLFFSFLKATLNGLKQFIFRSCHVCEVCACKVSCSSHIIVPTLLLLQLHVNHVYLMLVDGDMPLRTNFINREKNIFNKKNQLGFFWHYHACLWFAVFNTIILNFFTYEDHG